MVCVITIISVSSDRYCGGRDFHGQTKTHLEEMSGDRGSNAWSAVGTYARGEATSLAHHKLIHSSNFQIPSCSNFQMTVNFSTIFEFDLSIFQGQEHLCEVPTVPFLVLDEADRMVEKGHFQELTSIIELMKR